MVMEALEGFQDKVEYDVVGHSGETYYIPFVDPKKPPNDDKLRLETIKVSDWDDNNFIIRLMTFFFIFPDDARTFSILLVRRSHATSHEAFRGRFG